MQENSLATKEIYQKIAINSPWYHCIYEYTISHHTTIIIVYTDTFSWIYVIYGKAQGGKIYGIEVILTASKHTYDVTPIFFIFIYYW